MKNRFYSIGILDLLPLKVFCLFIVTVALTCKDSSKVQSLDSKNILIQQNINNELKYLAGRVNPHKHSRFQTVPRNLSIRRGTQLHKKALMAFGKMAAAARKQNINLYVYSGTRNFWAQKGIWEAKFSGQRRVMGKDLAKTILNEKKRALKILEYSSMPGTSRHHWGTDLDISFNKKSQRGMLTNKTYKQGGRGHKVYLWMQKNAAKFGFCQPYKNSPNRRSKKYTRGYFEERWHWSYKPIALMNMHNYRKFLKKLTPSGFLGDDVSTLFYESYVFNVHQDCL